jgi:hypothetical protein
MEATSRIDQAEAVVEVGAVEAAGVDEEVVSCCKQL